MPEYFNKVTNAYENAAVSEYLLKGNTISRQDGKTIYIMGLVTTDEGEQVVDIISTGETVNATPTDTEEETISEELEAERPNMADTPSFKISTRT